MGFKFQEGEIESEIDNDRIMAWLRFGAVGLLGLIRIYGSIAMFKGNSLRGIVSLFFLY